MPINGIETAYKDRYTFAPLSQRAAPIHWYTLPLRFITVEGQCFILEWSYPVGLSEGHAAGMDHQCD
jgi:hypothetical protein